MKVSEIMTRDVHMLSPEQTVGEAARKMSVEGVGALPIAEHDRLVGMITDRDIVVRAVSEGKPADTKLRRVMTPEIKYCFDDEDLDEVVQNMADIQVRRLPVVNSQKKLVGILALGDFGRQASRSLAGAVLAGHSR